MLYPKYVQIAKSELVIFGPEHSHDAMAKRLGAQAISAGLVGAARALQGKFFGESTTLMLSADRSLDWSEFAWVQGEIDRQPVFGTSKDLVRRLGGKKLRLAVLREYEGVHFLCASEDEAPALYGYFLP